MCACVVATVATQLFNLFLEETARSVLPKIPILGSRYIKNLVISRLYTIYPDFIYYSRVVKCLYTIIKNNNKLLPSV